MMSWCLSLTGSFSCKFKTNLMKSELLFPLYQTPFWVRFCWGFQLYRDIFSCFCSDSSLPWKKNQLFVCITNYKYINKKDAFTWTGSWGPSDCLRSLWWSCFHPSEVQTESRADLNIFEHRLMKTQWYYIDTIHWSETALHHYSQ